MAKRGIIGGAADAVKSVAGIAIGAAAAAATTAVIESVAKSLAKSDKGLDQALPLIENAVKARVSKPAQDVTDRLLTYERKRKTRKKPAVKRAAARRAAARRAAARRAAARTKPVRSPARTKANKKQTAPRRKR